LFVTGLARHLRDLLVAQDPRTLTLLEVPEDLIQRYADQALATDRDLIIKGLDRLAHCDANYKQSKEPRLLVELALIHLAGYRAANAGPGGGLDPRSAAPPPATAEKKNPDGGVVTAAAIAATSRVHAAGAIAAEPGPALVERPGPPQAPEPMAVVDTVGPAGLSIGAQAPRRRLANQVSIKASAVAVEEAAAPADTDAGPALPVSTKEVNTALLLKAWSDYAAAQRERGRSSLHATLTAREPVASGPGRITFAIVNDVQDNYMRNEKPELLGHLRRAMGDAGLELDVIKEDVVVKPRYTALDRFKLMAERNPALITLHEVVKLDLG
jgi:DNA polymerase-3 subunit gamma/tau